MFEENGFLRVSQGNPIYRIDGAICFYHSLETPTGTGDEAFNLLWLKIYAAIERHTFVKMRQR
jgi:hypothetical protein